MNKQISEALFEYCLRMGDNALILGHRLSEWCGHGPVLEHDIALTNIALDHVGHSRSILAYAGQVESKGRSEDDLAYLRLEHEFRNILLAEQPNGDFGQTTVRSFLYDHFNYLFMTALSDSQDSTLSAIAEKSVKEIAYHRKYSSEWIIRLGDGTEESHQRVQASVDRLWTFTSELFTQNDTDKVLIAAGIIPDISQLEAAWDQAISDVLLKATLQKPTAKPWSDHKGKEGIHTRANGLYTSRDAVPTKSLPRSQMVEPNHRV